MLAETPPVFVLANVSSLKLERKKWRGKYRVTKSEYRALQASYVRHWGPIWVAGAKTLGTADADERVVLPVAGPYTVESHEPVVIDGVERAGGNVITLSAGEHHVRGKAVLRWGDHLKRPSQPPPRTRTFVTFKYRAKHGFVDEDDDDDED
jgi:hypothetical protein